MKKEKEVTKSTKADIKNAKKLERVAIVKEKENIENRIDELKKKLKKNKNKAEKKDIKKQIKTLKYERSQVGKKPTFLGDVKEEMKLVRWPSKMEVFKYTLACLIFVIFFALFFFGIDALFALVKDLIG